ncbi:MAG: rod shape-determining protein MreC [Chitinophagaceae bacterium]|nr:rod shape-determining protein MreC [Chitinophagaceae bacterium]
MRNVFLFIRRYSNFLLFLVLQIIALYFLFSYNRFHEAAFSEVADRITGNINSRYNYVDYYFHLRNTNEQLVKENLQLRSLLKQNYEAPDTANVLVVDSILVDSIKKFQKYEYHAAKIVGSFVSTQTNYLTIHRGANQGIQRDMGVIGPLGIVGRIVDVSDQYATVMSVLSVRFKVKAKLKNGGENGTVEWDGASPSYIYLKDIPKSAKVKKGDSVLTSELSSIYPANIMVGTVADISADKESNFFSLKLKTATNFYSIQYVYVVGDLQREERNQLQEATKKTNE